MGRKDSSLVRREGLRPFIADAPPRESASETIEVNVDDGRGVKSQDLADQKTTDNRNAERLTQFRADAGTQRERQSAEQRGHGRHHDGTEAEQAGLIDGVDGILAFLALGFEGEVDHHDGVFLDDADQQDDADEGDDAELRPADDQRENRADARGRQRGKDRDRMNVAFIENPEDDVDRDDGREDQERFIGQRGLEGGCRALKSPLNAERHVNGLLGLLNRGRGVTERRARRQIERDGDHGELALVVDGQGSGKRFEMGDRAERNGSAVLCADCGRIPRRGGRARIRAGYAANRARGGGCGDDAVGICTGRAARRGGGERRAHINVVQVGRAALELRHHLEDDVILVELRVQGGDLALAKRVVERLIDHLGRDAHARSGDTVNDELFGQGAGLLIGGHVAKLGQLLELRHQNVGPMLQFNRVGILEGVLILRAADAVFDGQVLHGLHVEGDALDFFQRGLEPANDVAGGDLAVRQGLEIDQDAAVVEGGVDSIDSDERGKAFDGGVLKDDAGERLLPLGHGFEGSGRRRFGNALDESGVLNGEEAFGHDDVEPDGQHKGSDGDHECFGLVPEDPLKRPAIEADDAFENAFGSAVEAAPLRFGLMAEDFRAHHRSESQRDDGGDEDRDGKRDREFAEQAANNIAHEEQRNQNGDQRDGQRNNRESDLFGAFQCGLQGRVALFEEAVDVFDHDDGVVDDEACGDGERHQCEVVQAVAGEVHDAEGAHDRKGDGDAGDHGSGQVAEKEENQHDDETDSEHQLEFNVLDGGANRGGPVSDDGHFDRRGQIALQERHEAADAVHHLNDVGAGLALDVDNDGGLIVYPCGLPQILGSVDYIRNVGKSHGSAVAVGDDDRAKSGAGQKLVVGIDLIILARAVEIPLRRVEAGLLDRRADVLQVDAVGGERRRIHLDAHGGFLAAADADEADARQLGDFLREARVGQVLNLRKRESVRSKSERENGRVGRVRLAVDRRDGQVGRQIRLRRVDGGLHFLLGDIDVQTERKLQDDDRAAVGAGGGHLRQAGDFAELALEGRGYGGGGDFGACTGVERDDLNRRVIDFRQRRYGKLRERDDAGEHDGRHQQRGGDGPHDERTRRTQWASVPGLEGCEALAFAPGRPTPAGGPFAFRTATLTPFCSLSNPSTAMTWPACTPCTADSVPLVTPTVTGSIDAV